MAQRDPGVRVTDSPVGQARPESQTFRVNRYELNISVPSALRYVAVDVYRRDGERRVDLRDEQYRWEFTTGDDDCRRVDLRNGGWERLPSVPFWVESVLVHVGVDDVLDEG